MDTVKFSPNTLRSLSAMLQHAPSLRAAHYDLTLGKLTIFVYPASRELKDIEDAVWLELKEQEVNYIIESATCDIPGEPQIFDAFSQIESVEESKVSEWLHIIVGYAIASARWSAGRRAA